MSTTPNEQRDARAMVATMDHSDMRGLATAFHLCFAGLSFAAAVRDLAQPLLAGT
jgi:hypothetical protein